jgi:uracil-DNA glycosylase
MLQVSVGKMVLNKYEELRRLVQRRRDHVPDDYLCVSHFHGGKYDGDFVSPYTKSAHNICADLMIIGQDWASEDFLSKEFNPVLAKLGYDPTLETNRRLFGLLSSHMNLTFDQTYATNVFPFIKHRKMSNHIPPHALKEAAQGYALPQIAIIRPRMAIWLGIATFNAIWAAFCEEDGGVSKVRTLSWADYENQPSAIKYYRTEIYAVTHPGNYGRVRRAARIEPEWKRLAERLQELQHPLELE